MMAQKHLHELLQEDQEPFLLNNYISDRLNQLKKLSPNSALQLNKHKHKPTTNVNFCKNACFFSFQNTPDTRNSPLKSPIRSSNDIFLQIPSKTASLLLDAALKIQNNQTHCKNKNKNKSFGVLGSFFKKLTQRSRTKKNEITEGDVSVKDILRWDSSIRSRKSFNKSTELCSCEAGFTCSCNERHSSSAVWSESNEAETSSSSHSSDSVEEVEFVMMSTKKPNADCTCFDQHGFFCESPFRFILEKSPSTAGRRTPEFSSPVDSPRRQQLEDQQNNGVDGVNKFESGEDEEEEKEQCSPVSVLDTPFEDYHDEYCHENDSEEVDFELDCSYANVQKTKEQLLERLRRFEQLAELDPLELEKRMQEDNEYETLLEEDEREASSEEKGLREIVCEILYHHERWQEQEVLKRLVYDLIKEELNYSQDMNYVVKRVCKKMELWKQVESNTIDMMIEEDFSREEIGWKKNDEVTKELAREVEVAIFCLLVDEFSEELVC